MSDQEDIMADSEPITVASLFSGAGGLDIGFSENPAFEIALHLDVDETAVETLEANRGTYVDEDAVLLCEDIREVADAVLDDRPNEFDIPATLGDEVDFIIGGPPCQPFSAAARRAGGTEGTDSEEGRLFEAYVDLLDKWQPAGFLFENVSGVTSNEEDWEPIVEAFRGAGYVVEKPRTARTLNAADYGVPQHRARTFIVGVREDIDVDYHFPKPTHDEDSEGDLKSVTAGEALADLDNDDVEAETPYEVTSKHAHLLDDIPPGLNYSFYTEKLGHPDPVFGWRSRFSDYLYKTDPEEPVRTLKAQPGAASGPFHWDNRKFTEEELKRLQSFPEDYILTGSYGDVVKQIGNSVPPQIAAVLAQSIAKQIFGREPEVDLPIVDYGPQQLPEIEPMPAGFDLNFRARKRTSSEEYERKARERLIELELWEPSNARDGGQSGLEQFDDGDAPTVAEERETYEYAWGFDSYFDEERADDIDELDRTYERRFRVTSSVEKGTLNIDVNGVDQGAGGIEIRLERSNGTLLSSIGVSEITLTATNCDVDSVFYLWSLLKQDVLDRTEYEKLEDVVGHYSTTRSDYSSELTVEGIEETPVTAALSFFSREDNCNAEMTLGDFARRSGLEPNEAVDAIEQLRQWRYEIRTPATHSTMATADGVGSKILCTYPFPDLTSTSHFDADIELTDLHEEAERVDELATKEQ